MLYDAPGPRAVVRNRIISAVTVVGIVVVVWFVVAKLQAKGQLTEEKWEPFTTADLWRTYILPGVQGTLTAAALSIVLAGLLGIMLGVGRLATNRWVRSVCGTAVEFFRAVPVLIMMIFAYFLFAKYDVLELLYLDRLYDVVGTVKLIGGLGDSGLSFACFAYVLVESPVPGHVQAAAVVVAPVISFQTAKRPAITCR